MKKIRLQIIAAAAAIFITACATSPTDDGNTIAAANPDGVMCVREPDMGSRLGRRVCTTRAERDAAAQITREEITNRQRSETRVITGAPAGIGN